MSVKILIELLDVCGDHELDELEHLLGSFLEVLDGVEQQDLFNIDD